MLVNVQVTVSPAATSKVAVAVAGVADAVVVVADDAAQDPAIGHRLGAGVGAGDEVGEGDGLAVGDGARGRHR